MHCLLVIAQRGQQGLQASKVRRGPPVQPALLAQQGYKVQRVTLVRMAEQPALQVLQGLMVLMEAPLALPAIRV